MQLKVNLVNDFTTATALAQLRTGQYASVVITDVCLPRGYLLNLFIKRCNALNLRVTFNSIRLINRIEAYDNLYGKIDVMPCILRSYSA